MAGAAGACALVLLASCSAAGSAAAPSLPGASVATSATASSTNGTGAARLDGVDGDAVVWKQTDSLGPLRPPAGDAPAVTIYADGRILVIDEVRGATRARLGTVDGRDLEDLLARAADSGVFDGADLGEFQLPRIRSSSVEVLTEDGTAAATVYAPGIEDTELVPGLSDEQIAHRKALLDLTIDARALATGLAQWTPARIRAVAIVPRASEELVDEELVTELLPAPWPGPSFATFPEPDEETSTSCLVIEGDEAADVFHAANENLEGYWTDQGTVWQVDTVPLVPGDEGCT